MYHVVAATSNPAKITAISHAFNDLLGAEQCQVSHAKTDSGVSEQPMTSDETLQGARQRVANARQHQPDADYWVAIEAGIDGQQTFAWIVIDNGQRVSESRSASLSLPASVIRELHQGRELGEIMAGLTGIENIKQQGGAIGVVTQGLLSRSSVYHQALILALSPLLHPWYTEPL